MNWREQLQAEIDDTARLRANSLYRQGDSITSTKPCLEGAGRARVMPRVIHPASIGYYRGFSYADLLQGVSYADN